MNGTVIELHREWHDDDMPTDMHQRLDDLRDDLADIRLSMRSVAASQTVSEVNQARIEGKVDVIEASVSAVNTVELSARVLLQGQRLDSVITKVDQLDVRRWDLTKLAIEILGAGTVGAALIEGVKRLMGGH